MTCKMGDSDLLQTAGLL